MFKKLTVTLLIALFALLGGLQSVSHSDLNIESGPHIWCHHNATTFRKLTPPTGSPYWRPHKPSLKVSVLATTEVKGFGDVFPSISGTVNGNKTSHSIKVVVGLMEAWRNDSGRDHKSSKDGHRYIRAYIRGPSSYTTEGTYNWVLDKAETKAYGYYFNETEWRWVRYPTPSTAAVEDRKGWWSIKYANICGTCKEEVSSFTEHLMSPQPSCSHSGSVYTCEATPIGNVARWHGKFTGSCGHTYYLCGSDASSHNQGTCGGSAGGNNGGTTVTTTSPAIGNGGSNGGNSNGGNSGNSSSNRICGNTWRGSGACTSGRVASSRTAHQSTCAAGHTYWSCNPSALSTHSRCTAPRSSTTSSRNPPSSRTTSSRNDWRTQSRTCRRCGTSFTYYTQGSCSAWGRTYSSHWGRND